MGSLRVERCHEEAVRYECSQSGFTCGYLVDHLCL
jgi:predicted RNA-binding Zn-ribbon protein involved in translation (DUF1610 family)